MNDEPNDFNPARDRFNPARDRFIVGITGASGVIYGVRLVEALLADPRHEVHVTVTGAGQRVMMEEIGARLSGAGGGPAACFNLTDEQAARLVVHPASDIGAGPASGTFPVRATIVAPCSMNTLAAIAHGLADNLLTRAAAVTLKEGRPLVLVPRETPLGLIELRNMVAATEAGATILPANPGFYHDPTTIEDLVRFIVQKVLDRLGVEMKDAVRWGEGVERRATTARTIDT
jgi:4-hydroxy-3-polyprenylbenzoate decarboxylase